MTNTEAAIARYVRTGGTEADARSILTNNINTYGATFGVVQATLMEYRMATAGTVERLARGILEELAA